MSEQEEPKKSALSSEEVTWILQAFLHHPSRVKNGATEEEMLKVISWAHELKVNLLVNLGILYEVYAGTLDLNIKDDEVVMSVAENPEERDPEHVLNFETLMSLL
jgi:hypothetical protein